MCLQKVVMSAQRVQVKCKMPFAEKWRKVAVAVVVAVAVLPTQIAILGCLPIVSHMVSFFMHLVQGNITGPGRVPVLTATDFVPTLVYGW